MALVVNGERIDDSEIAREVERLRPRYEQVFADKAPQEREEQLLHWSRENVIERTLLRQEAAKDCQPASEAEIEAAMENLGGRFDTAEAMYAALEVENDQQARAVVATQIRTQRKVEQVYAGLAAPSAEQIRAFYEQNKEQFRSAEKVRVAHIVKHVTWQANDTEAQEAMAQARQEIRDGAAFEAVVAKYSDCPDRGGDIGLVSRGELVEEFEDVVFKLQVGQVSDVFRTRFGYHIAKVYNRLPSAVLDLEHVKAKVVNELTEKMRDQALGDYLDNLVGQATIEEA